MTDIIKKTYLYYLTPQPNNQEYQKLLSMAQEQQINFDKLTHKVEQSIKRIKQKAQKLGYEIDFESFYNMLQDYISQKDDLEENTKKDYLFILATLSEIYDINLRQELENYVSLKNPQTEGMLVIKYCYYLMNNEKEDYYNDLIKLINLNKLDLNLIRIKANKEVSKIKKQTTKLGFDTDIKSFNKMLQDYISQKDQLSQKEKERYLRLLVLLSHIYDFDIKKYLAKANSKRISIKKLIASFSNPLKNNSFLKSLLLYRFNNGYFQVEELSIPNTTNPSDNDKKINYYQEQSYLLQKIINIYLDKINNYCFEDLNQNISFNLNDEDYELIKNLTTKQLFIFVKNIKEGINQTEIINNLNINYHIYYFLSKTLTTIDFTKDNIGLDNYNLFTYRNEPFDLKIYINTSNSEETGLFLGEYIYKCINNNLSYHMVGLNHLGINKDRTILYTSKNDLPLKIKILNEIKKEHPDWNEKFGSPIASGATLNNSYYAISFAYLENNNHDCKISYHDYFNYLSEVAYYRTLAKIVINKITKKEDLLTVKNFISCQNITYLENNDLHSIKFNNIEFIKIKDIINCYIPEISRTLKLYFEQEDKLNILTKEFSKSLLYLNNLINSKNKYSDTNIALINL